MTITMYLYLSIIGNAYLKSSAMSLKLEIRLHTHTVGTSTRSGTKAIFALI